MMYICFMSNETTGITLSKRQQVELEQMTRRTASKRESQRAQIILDYRDGMSKPEISRKHGLHRNRVIDLD